MFNKFDIDGDGTLTCEEVRKAIGSMFSEEELDDLLFDLYGEDEEGEVDCDEFIIAMRARMEEPEITESSKEESR